MDSYQDQDEEQGCHVCIHWAPEILIWRRLDLRVAVERLFMEKGGSSEESSFIGFRETPCQRRHLYDGALTKIVDRGERICYRARLFPAWKVSGLCDATRYGLGVRYARFQFLLVSTGVVVR